MKFLKNPLAIIAILLFFGHVQNISLNVDLSDIESKVDKISEDVESIEDNVSSIKNRIPY